MTDDLVTRLRARADDVRMFLAGDTTLDVEAAADRIEKLETALKKIAMTPPFGEPQEIARAALEGKDAPA